MSVTRRSRPVGAPFRGRVAAGTSTHEFEIHRRDADIALIRTKIERPSEGTGAVVIVQGGAGIGESRLLTEAQRTGKSLGIAVGSGAADPGESVVELAVLLSALFDGHATLLDRRELTNLRALTEQRFWVLQESQHMLERAALEAPIMITIDDVQWADSGTAAALRTVLDLIGEAHGSPFLLVEMLLGLWEEGRIRVVGGRAKLVDGRLPDRVGQGMRERVARLSEASNNAVTVAASLGRTFTDKTSSPRPTALASRRPAAELRRPAHWTCLMPIKRRARFGHPDG
jgi:AAA ATPase domain